MADNRLIESIHLSNFLSFGPDAPAIPLESLNVLIGPNGSGKTNLIEAIELLKAAPTDFADPIRNGRGVHQWVWRGIDKARPTRVETLFANIRASHDNGRKAIPLRHIIEFGATGERLEILDETIEESRKRNPTDDHVFFYYQFRRGHPVINTLNVIGTAKDEVPKYTLRGLQRDLLPPDQSILSQRKDPELYPDLTRMGRKLAGIQTFREWSFGRLSLLRRAQPTDLPNDALLPDGQNLALILNDLEHRGETWSHLLELCKKLLPRFKNLSVKVAAGNAQIFLHEKGLNAPIPGTRLSDGTLRFLCLAAILLHPSPPPLICIEEPEIGLHPDAISTLADVIIEASKRTQLIVTTHSDVLVNALTDRPSAVLVAEQRETGTEINRLEPQRLKEWLERYSLGQLWMKGEIGGVRW